MTQSVVKITNKCRKEEHREGEGECNYLIMRKRENFGIFEKTE